MADSRDFLLAEAATSAACAQHYLHSALDATQLLHRYSQMMGAVARRQISPERASALIAHSAHSTAVPDETERAFTAFSESLTRCCFVSTQTAATDDLASRAAELDEHTDDGVIMRHQHALDLFTTQVAALADPSMSAGARRRALTRSHNASANQLISDAAAQWFTVLSAISGAQSRTLAPALLETLRAAQPVGFSGHVVELSGVIGTDITTSLTVENERDTATSVHFALSDVRRADGIGPAFEAHAILSPERAVLDAHAVGTIAISLRLDAARFADNALYVGALTVTNEEGAALDIPLRITIGRART